MQLRRYKINVIKAITSGYYYLYFKVLLTTTTACKDLGIYHKSTRVFNLTEQET
jgi:hypothetical protein